MNTLTVLIAILCVYALGYRYYSAFLAAKVLVLQDERTTPAHRFKDGQNYSPTPKWVLFGHHFAAIAGAGPLVGPTLAAQFGFAPGLLWLVLGAVIAGAVQDFTVLVASVRHQEDPPRRTGSERCIRSLGGNRINQDAVLLEHLRIYCRLPCPIHSAFFCGMDGKPRTFRSS